MGLYNFLQKHGLVSPDDNKKKPIEKKRVVTMRITLRDRGHCRIGLVKTLPVTDKRTPFNIFYKEFFRWFYYRPQSEICTLEYRNDESQTIYRKDIFYIELEQTIK